MYLQHFGFESPPFTRQPNPDVFFSQAGRKNILKALRHDLQQEHAVMLLTGPKGAGKTTCCRLIRHRLDGSSYKVVYLDTPVGSFEALLRQICGQLGMSSTADIEQDITVVLQPLLQSQKDKGRRVLLLIDDAEKMFLAALERLFRLLDEMNTTYGMQMFLAGQPALNASIEQLSDYCEDVRIASIYELTPFSEEESAAYLTYRLRTAKHTKGKKKKKAPLFSEEAVQKIARLGKGIPGLIDEIAETSLEKAALHKADAVQLNHVALPEKPQITSSPTGDTEDKKRGKGLLLLLALILFALFFFARPSLFSTQKKTGRQPIQASVTLSPENTEIEIAVPAVPEEEETSLPFAVEAVEKDVEGNENQAETSSSPQEEEKTSLLSLPVPQRPDFKKKDKNEASEDNTTADSESQAPAEEESTASTSITLIEEEKDEEKEKAPVQENIPKSETSETKKQELKEAVQSASSSEGDTETLTTAKKLPVIQPTSIIELTPGMKKTKPPGSQNPSPATETHNTDSTTSTNTAPPKQKTLIPVASAQGIAPSASPNASSNASSNVSPPSSPPPSTRETEAIQVPKITIPTISSPSRAIKADQFFARYLGAGSRWTKEAYGDKFTVQLLVLSSDDVVKNIKNMIVRDEYQEHQRKLYILRRKTLPPTFFVCYGVYGSIDEARNARNTMPLFLRKHHPYALSITDVLAKARD